MRKTSMVAVILGVIGFGLLLTGFALSGENLDSCPATASSCDHTFVGTNLYIGVTAEEVEIASVFVLQSSITVFYYGRRMERVYKLALLFSVLAMVVTGAAGVANFPSIFHQGNVP